MSFTITPVDPDIAEASGTYTFTVAASITADVTLFIGLVPLNNANVSGAFLQTVSHTFSPDTSGLATFDVDVFIMDDGLVEGNETFAIVLLPTADANPLTDYIARSIFTVIDDEFYVAGDDYADSITDPLNAMGQISLGQTVAGSLETSGDNDFFRVTLTAGTAYAIGLNGAVTSSGALHDPFVLLYNSNGSLVAFDDDSGAGSNSLLTYTPSASGDFFVVATGYNNVGTGIYQVTLAANGGASGAADDYADNRTDTPMGAITPGQTVSGNVESAGDKDWFAVTLEAGTTYSFALNGSTAAAGTLYDPFVSLYNGDGVLLATDDDSGTGNNSLLLYTATVGGTYYVEAGSFSASATGTYQVVVSGGSSAGVDIPASTATGAALNEGQTFSSNVGFAGDKDWFATYLFADTTSTFALNGAANSADTLYDPFVALYNSSGVRVAFDDDSGAGNDSLLSYTVSVSDFYFVEAGSFSASGTGTYQISLATDHGAGAGGNGATDDYADSRFDFPVGAITPGQTVSGNVETAADKDWFAVTLEAGNTYSFALNGATAAAGTLYDPFVSLYNSDGIRLATDDDSGTGNNSLLQYAATYGGIYYIEAGSFSASGTGTYELGVTGGGGSGGSDDYADNRTDSPMGAITPGQTVSGNVESAADKDWFAVTLEAGNTYSFALNGATAAAGTLSLYDPFVSLYNSVGILLGTDDDGGPANNSLLQYAATYDGIYYIEARGYSAIATGTYQLDIDLVGVSGA